MHKNNALWLLLHISGIMLGAASSSSDVSTQANEFDTAAIEEMAMRLPTMIQSIESMQQDEVKAHSLIDEKLIEISLAHLPEEVQEFTALIATGRLVSGTALFLGPPGMGKTTAAECIAQKFYGKNGHVFSGTSLRGNQYQNSGVMALQQSIAPIIERAQYAPQMVIIDEFQKLFQQDTRPSSETAKVEGAMLSLFNEMKKTNKIIFIGTCNAISDLPAPLLDRIKRRFLFNTIPKEFCRTALQFHLERTGAATPEDLTNVLTKCPATFRSIETIVEIALGKATLRAMKNKNDTPAIIETDLLSAIEIFNRERDPMPFSWTEWAKKHDTQLMSAASLALTAVGLYLQYKYQNDNVARHIIERTEDLTRSQKEEFVKKIAMASSGSIWTPRNLQYEYVIASDEVKAVVAANDEKFWRIAAPALSQAVPNAVLATQAGIMGTQAYTAIQTHCCSIL